MILENRSSVTIVIKISGLPKNFPPGIREYPDDILGFWEFRRALERYPFLSVLPKRPSDTVIDKSLETAPDDKLTKGVMKRGRPKFEDSLGSLETLKPLYPHIKTRRGLQNKFYELRALKVIKNLVGMEFLFDLKTGNIKPSILTEIGRAGDDEMMREVAAKICKRARTEKHTVKQWVLLARYLTGEDNLGSRFLNRQKKKNKT